MLQRARLHSRRRACFGGARFLLHIDDDYSLVARRDDRDGARAGLRRATRALAQNKDVTALVFHECDKAPRRNEQGCAPLAKYRDRASFNPRVRKCHLAMALRGECTVQQVQYRMRDRDDWCAAASRASAAAPAAEKHCADAFQMWNANRFLVDLEKLDRALPLLDGEHWHEVRNTPIEFLWNRHLHNATLGRSVPYGRSRHNVLHAHSEHIGICTSRVL